MAYNFGTRQFTENDSFKSSGDLTSNIYRFVKKTDAETVGVVAATGDLPVGVQYDIPKTTDSGEEVAVVLSGQARVECSEALALDDLVSPSANGRAQKATGGQYVCGRVVRATGAAGDVAIIELLTVPQIYINPSAGLSGVSAIALHMGKTITEGYNIKIIDELVAMDGNASNALTETVPAGARIIGACINLNTVITATTAVKVGLGTSTGTDDPDLYALSGDLLLNTKNSKLAAHAILSAEEVLEVFACDTNGAAAGTLDTGTVRVWVIYEILDSLDDAA